MGDRSPHWPFFLLDRFNNIVHTTYITEIQNTIIENATFYYNIEILRIWKYYG
jgi:hypothetical protein